MIPPLFFWVCDAEPGAVQLVEILLIALGILGALIELIRQLRDGFRESVRAHIIRAETLEREDDRRRSLLEQVVFMGRGVDEPDDNEKVH